MSLLLDALKKAAEQKARKSKSEEPENRSSDETLLDVGAVDETARLAADDLPRSAREDETILDQTQVEERHLRANRVADDDTSLDTGDSTQTQLETDSRAAAAVADDTGIDIPDTTETVLIDEQPTPAADDDTGIDIPDATETVIEQKSDETVFDETGLDLPEVTETQLMQEQDDVDETGIDIRETTETVLDQERPATAETDETGLDLPDVTETVQAEEDSQGPGGDDATGVDITEAGSVPSAGRGEQLRKGEDETVVSGLGDVADFAADSELDSRRPVARDDITDLNHPGASDGEQMQPGFKTAADSGDSHPETDDDTLSNAGADSDEDLSLVLELQEMDSTTTGATTGFTDPKILVNRGQVPAPGDPGPGRADITQGRTSADQTDTQGPTLTSPTATVLHGDDTLGAPTRTNVTRTDSTSTRTYAPDNYDRTLMKLPSDDASKLFAGMKPDADVVMTPDYAKKVFQSKNSTQRTRHYQTYLGIGLILVLLVGGYGVFEYEAESTQIENSLRPLKRDPMPGVIKTQQEPDTNLFGESSEQVDSRTIEIIAAASDGVVASEPESATEPAAAEQQATAADDTAVAMAQPPAQATAVQSKPPQSSTTVASADMDGGEAMTSSTTYAKGNLNIKSSSQFQQADIWLREAYEAYRAGNDQLAMQRYNQVLTVDPGNRNALLARAAISIQNGAIDAAIRDYQALLLMNPKDSMAMSSLLAIASFSPQETESQLKLMIQEEPESPYLNFALANAYGAQNRWHEAQGHYFKALQNNPGDPNYAYNLAVSLEHISQPRSAATYYQRALDNFGNGLATFSREVVAQRLEVLGKL